VWLGGVHWKTKTLARRNRDSEEPEEVELVHRVRARPNVQARLRELAQGQEKWEREGARLALDPKDSEF
jgi:hypothetical protein